jgi:hypothetical protein
MRRTGLRLIDRLVAFFLLVLMAVGSFALWTLVPSATLRFGVGTLESPALQLIAGLTLVPAAMIAFSFLLLWLNGLYLRVTGHWTYDEEEGRPRRLRGPLEPLMIWSLVLALITLVVWFFFFAEGEPLGYL